MYRITYNMINKLFFVKYLNISINFYYFITRILLFLYIEITFKTILQFNLHKNY